MPESEFNIDACNVALSTAICPFQLVAMAECDSTNTQLMRLAESGVASGTVVIADRQTAGRGRRSRPWISSPQHSLTFSLLWRFQPDSPAPEALSLVVGLALQRALVSLGVVTAVKWPNDILCEGRKVAGVLIEAQSGDIKSIIIGIGINLGLPPDMPQDIAAAAIALDQLTQMPPTRERLLALLLTHLAETLTQYTASGFVGLRGEWQSCHAYNNCEVQISGGGENISGICTGVTERGELLLNTADGIRHIISGDVSLRAA